MITKKQQAKKVYDEAIAQVKKVYNEATDQVKKAKHD